MATDIGRINAAMGGIRALDYQGSEKWEVLSHLGALELAVKKDQAAREEARIQEGRTTYTVKNGHPDFLRSVVDYQDAPHRTQIAKRFGSGWWMKINDGWIDNEGTVMPSSHIAAAPRKVLKWGAV